jgi:hypothetical protein
MKTRETPSLYGFLLLLAWYCACAPQTAAQEAVSVPVPQLAFDIGVGEARLLPIVGVPKTIIVGDDTTIAANVIQGDILVFTGIAHGKTNVIVLDSSGRILKQVWISVTKSGAPLTVRRGIATEEFRCNPNCRPEERNPAAPTSGDSAGVSG